ncbi:family 20 glycosylhydrolase [Collinsella sp. AGMB00827]|uniref:Family 20 glycosylhydrolase n=2 Tax=Collinsella ureilytica TaxID=2869515 RepID=A0ABS7MHX6_9ACTN|nr:family 20 glycosylhydrolase [Collinsella urealyticum]MBY4796953.1 family 20 glycosylhydrolase [Collinsella urealyticum]
MRCVTTGVVAALLVVAGFAFAPLQARAEQKSPLKSIFSLDAGRKYFSEDQLKQIIDRAYTDGYTDVQLILGNDGLRFLLDDMSLTVNGTTYTSDDVKAAIKAGNDVYHKDANGNALTQAEMDRIVAYAKAKGVGIVPLINSPGHMDAVLIAMEQLGLQNVRFAKNGETSKRTVDITNKEAVDFVYALLQKYVEYFQGAGNSTYFNFGADEFANDVFGNPGWSFIQRSGVYRNFVEYVNHVSGIIKAAGMQPVCFNDGIYYNRNTSFGTFDKALVVSYWTSGWFGFNVAKPEFLAEQGLRILNTNDAWYWVLGRIDNGGYKFTNAVANLSKRKFTDVTGARGPIDIVGSMQCVWCDEPGNAYDPDRIFQLMDGFKAAYADHMLKPADYTAVDEALAKIPADLSSYTTDSANRVVAARDAVVRGMRSDNQKTVDGYATAIENAVADLVKLANYTAVDQAMARIPADLSVYTDETAQALHAARDSVVRDLPASQQAQVDAMAAALNNAVDGLVKKDSGSEKKDPSSGKEESGSEKKDPRSGKTGAPIGKQRKKAIPSTASKPLSQLPKTADASLVAAGSALGCGIIACAMSGFLAGTKKRRSSRS